MEPCNSAPVYLLDTLPAVVGLGLFVALCVALVVIDWRERRRAEAAAQAEWLHYLTPLELEQLAVLERDADRVRNAMRVPLDPAAFGLDPKDFR